MKIKLKIIGFFMTLIIVVIALFSIFYKIQTFFKAALIEFNSSQILQVTKNQQTNFYLDKTIYLKDNSSTYKTYVTSISEDGNYYYLTTAKYFYDYAQIDTIWIYNKKVSLGSYVLSSLFDI